MNGGKFLVSQQLGSTHPASPKNSTPTHELACSSLRDICQPNPLICRPKFHCLPCSCRYVARGGVVVDRYSDTDGCSLLCGGEDIGNSDIYVSERECAQFSKAEVYSFAQAYKVENMSGGGGVDGEVDCRRRQGSGDLPRLFFLWRRNLGMFELSGRARGKAFGKASHRTSIPFVGKDHEKCGTEVKVMHFILQ
jgi:hypothetical protein